MLYLIFTIDGDWEGYFDIKLSGKDLLPHSEFMETLIHREMEMTARIINGRFIHFIHTSPLARDFFLKKDFLRLWKGILKNGGDIGLHCHEDEPYKHYYCQDTSRMRAVISERVKAFKKAGLDPRCYRGGFLGFSSHTVKILEENGIYFDFSCEPGRFLTSGKDLICDWRAAPQYQYRMSYNDHCKPGDSRVWEIPVGTSEGRYLYFEKIDLKELEKIALDLKNRSMHNRCNIVVSVLSHTYEYASLGQIKSIEEKLNLLKEYGTFINLKELEDIIKTS